jgi:hypothetical protein
VAEFVDRRCQGATLAFSTIPPGGQLSQLAEVRRKPGEDGHFHVALSLQPGEPLFLNLLDYTEGTSIDYCLLKIDPLVTRRAAH